MYERLTKRFLGSNAPYTEFADYNEIINRLCDLEDKIEKGKIVELPCQIGDEKFAILPNTNVIVKGKVCTIVYQNGFLIDFAYKSEEYDYTAYAQLLPEELFDTYEEAEAKLKGADDD
jgi:hypothetical protein